MWRDARLAATNSVFFAFAGTAALLGLARLSVRRLRRLPRAIAAVAGLAIGAVAGSVLSIAVWVCFGGWGPPFLRPAAVAGSLITSRAWAVLVDRRTA